MIKADLINVFHLKLEVYRCILIFLYLFFIARNKKKGSTSEKDFRARSASKNNDDDDVNDESVVNTATSAKHGINIFIIY